MVKVLAFGEILWDIIEGEAHLGGAPLNFASHIRQCGLSAGILSCLGNDDWGNKAMQAVEESGLDTRLILRRNKNTGIVDVKIINGQPQYDIIKPVAYDYIDVGNLSHEVISEFDVFYFGTLAQRAMSTRESLYKILDQHKFKEVFYDVNLRKDSYTGEVIERSLQHCTILKINDEEVPEVSSLLWEEMDIEAFCKHVQTVFPKIKVVLVTAGSAGSYVSSSKGINHSPAVKITVADTVGAGDACSAAFLSTYIKTGDALKAAAMGNMVGGFVASNPGAIPKYSDEIQKALTQ
ncbi:MAG: carbohydrate kinase [Marinoscillum sp.]